MKKQDKIIIFRVANVLKNQFNEKAENNAMSLSTRLKYLMSMDIKNKINFKDEE
jgi:type II secretory ATPase GspE/PulE/Tfp pilus assembly ATPase PilB-like protein